MNSRRMFSFVWECFAFSLQLIFLEKRGHCPKTIPAHRQKRLLMGLTAPFPGRLLWCSKWNILIRNGSCTLPKVQNWVKAQLHLKQRNWVL